jgi:hypothetical protein
MIPYCNRHNKGRVGIRNLIIYVDFFVNHLKMVKSEGPYVERFAGDRADERVERVAEVAEIGVPVHKVAVIRVAIGVEVVSSCNVDPDLREEVVCHEEAAHIIVDHSAHR